MLLFGIQNRPIYIPHLTFQCDELKNVRDKDFLFLVMLPIVFHSGHQCGYTACFPFDISLWEMVIEARNNSWTIEQLISLKHYLG